MEHIINPILTTLDSLQSIHDQDAQVARWIGSTFGGVPALRKAILRDFFCYGFDGSGADNFFDARSCIDGAIL